MNRYVGQDLQGSFIQELLPHGTGCTILLAHECIHQPGSSLTLVVQEF